MKNVAQCMTVRIILVFIMTCCKRFTLLALTLLTTLPVVASDTTESRQPIMLSATEKQLVLAEMRIFLNSVQQIVDGISRDDMVQVAAAARRSGLAAQATVPQTLAAKLPLAFKKLGRDTHAKFDNLALDATQLGDGEHSLQQLNALLQNCVSCHAAFRFE